MSNEAAAILGPALVGNTFNMMFFGIMIAQMYIYFRTYKDPTWIRLLVVAVFIADIISVVFSNMFLYDALIVHFADMESLTRANRFLWADPITTGVLGFIVQLYFARTIRSLTKCWFIVVIIVSLAIAGFVSSIINAYKIVVTPEFSRLHEFKEFAIIWLASVCAVDFIIAATMVLYLRTHRTGFKESNKMIDRIILVTVPTGLAPSLCALLTLCAFVTKPKSGLYLAFNFPLAVLYSNSLLNSLNSRRGSGCDVSEPNTTEAESFEMVTQPDPQDIESKLQSSATHPTKTIDLFRPTKRSSSGVPSEVFVHVESREMRDSDYQCSSRPVSLGGSEGGTLGPTPPQREVEQSVSSQV
ncbi:hypothetical protein P691DRAFT_810246 [Macrolepiota fuliginosa MF-IS2]|uniref:DUF6534 domain-containing protein n=1 Tax=Macrolepiota fuliginosa MF-IS2 TaxID=1400762 RepID=A0A9P6BYH6_9AGAR|nr:hypothetical protein P691DRAFT_810246 [Macrolepiota fuliginosa MF-IS2]